ncbi:MAG: class I SAM-dependent methyltransferase [Armatimonadetes bacterium]|nr:class I SAM-dependent methyltransferase [Armatimonadota bacterium]
MQPWHEDDSFWELLAPHMFPPQRVAAAVGDVDSILRLTGLAPGAAVLDLCCGPGRHALEFARRGFRVTGVDRTAAHLQRARAAASDERLDIEFVLADAREFARPAAFDLALNLFTSFGYFADPSDDLRVARNLYDSLRPGGRLIMELMGKEVLARIFQPRGWEEADSVILLQERAVCQDWGWIENRWILVGEGTTREWSVGHRLYSAVELKRLLQDAGFTACAAFGALSGAPYDHQAQRLVVLATRPA